MDYLGLKEKWLIEERQSFKGWNFSYLHGRWEDETIPWNYEEWISKYLDKNHTLLDIGTGGGEFLLSLNHPYANTSVTEAWEPNVKLCKEKLSPLGITVKQVFDDNELPFDNDTFDIVINRHEAYDVREIKRVLKNDGIFITQQVGDKNNEILSKFLIPNFIPKYAGLTLKNQVNKFENENFSLIYGNEYFPYLRFFDIGAIVYFAKIIEWEFPDFSVEKCFSKLCKLQDKLLDKGYIESLEHRYIIVAKNNK